MVTVSGCLVAYGWGWLVLGAEGCGVPVLCPFRSGDRFGWLTGLEPKDPGLYQTHRRRPRSEIGGLDSQYRECIPMRSVVLPSYLVLMETFASEVVSRLVPVLLRPASLVIFALIVLTLTTGLADRASVFIENVRLSRSKAEPVAQHPA